MPKKKKKELQPVLKNPRSFTSIGYSGGKKNESYVQSPLGTGRPPAVLRLVNLLRYEYHHRWKKNLPIALSFSGDFLTKVIFRKVLVT